MARDDAARAKLLGSVGLASVTEAGVRFETGVPARFRFIRNTQPSPKNLGNRFGQDVEPTGRYMLHDTVGHHAPPPGWVQGAVSFRSPLVLVFNTTPGEIYGATDWKHRLARITKLKGMRLSLYLRRLGFDAIVTVRDGETSEIVDLERR